MTNWQNCPGNQSIKINFTANNAIKVPNKIFFSGYFDVSQYVSGPIKMVIESNRCNLKMTDCDFFPGLSFDSMCQRISKEGTLFHDAWITFTPKFTCPITSQKYEAKNTSVDLTMIEHMPLSGYAWLTTIKLTNGVKKQETVMCVLFEFKIVRAGVRRG